ncbi:glycosyltransferase [Vacuolonema iberomarrocanum]|uniref:glycosyltransferase n=1 Tax=Vacuolonema iberomarrocanum TaxID=3454632 RepID=UPI001A024B6E|nr:glycosyltransferase [filamentous cyanobacterium LEGE 07170]
MKRPKVLFISPYLSLTYGGTSKSVDDLALTLGRSGISLDLITTNANVNTCLDVPLRVWLEQNAYRIQYFPAWFKNDLIVSRSLLKWLSHHATDYDLVHTHTIFSPLISYCHWICQRHAVPYITTPHGMLEPWALRYKRWKKQIYFSLIERANLLKASSIHSIAKSESNNIASLCPDTTIQLIPNGVHWHDFVSLASPDAFYQRYPALQNQQIILFLGRIDPKKGLDLLASAFGSIYRQFPNAHLVVAGPDSIDFLPTATQYFADAHCLEAVTFTGMLTGHLKYSALAAADMYVAPSYSEGFSMSVLEGMASGLPCVITIGCNFPEAAGSHVAHVVDIDSEAIAHALITCLKDPQAAKAMGDRARQFIFEHYTWDKVATQLMNVYQAILNKQSSIAS